MVKLNRKHKNGSWTLSSDYLRYRRDGGAFSPDVWNFRIKEIEKESKKLLRSK